MGDPRPFSLILFRSCYSAIEGESTGNGDERLRVSCGGAGASCRVGGAYGDAMEPVVGVVLRVLGALNVRCWECAIPREGDGSGDAAARRKPTR